MYGKGAGDIPGGRGLKILGGKMGGFLIIF